MFPVANNLGDSVAFNLESDTQRRTFRNLVGHVENVGDLGQLAAWTNSQFDPTLSWKDVGWVKERFGGRVIVKGVLDPEDAR